MNFPDFENVKEGVEILIDSDIEEDSIKLFLEKCGLTGIQKWNADKLEFEYFPVLSPLRCEICNNLLKLTDVQPEVHQGKHGLFFECESCEFKRVLLIPDLIQKNS